MSAPATAPASPIVTPDADPRAQVEAMRPRPRRDRQIWGIYILLVIISVIELYSASSREVTAGNILGPLIRHAGLLFVGFLIMVGLQRVHYKRFYNFAYIIVGLCVLGAIYTMFFGEVVNGARRSFRLFGIIGVQSSELLKFAAALLIARVLCNYRVKLRPGHEEEDIRYNRRLVFIVAATVLCFGGMLITQGLTNTVLLMVISLSMMLIGGVRWKEFGMVVVVYAILALSFQGVKHLMGSDDNISDQEAMLTGQTFDRTNLQKNRFTDWLRTDKYNDSITSRNRQEQYSYIAQANGGIFGVFPGNSRETARLPLAFSDYIYAIVIEDMGLLGGAVVMLLYLWLLARAGRIAMKCKKAFPALLVIGMAVFIVYQAIMHMGIVTGFLPVSGQPLPLISKGGSSVIMTSVALGIMLSVSRFAARKGARQELQDNISTLSDNEMPDNPTQI